MGRVPIEAVSWDSSGQLYLSSVSSKELLVRLAIAHDEHIIL